jgi:hypothetical protein
MQLDQLIKSMEQKDATQLVISSDAPPRLLTYGQWIQASDNVPSATALDMLLQSAVPSHLKSELSRSSGALEWEHFAVSGKYKIQVYSVFGTRTITITQEVAARQSTPATPHAARQAASVDIQAPPVLPVAPPSTPVAPPPLPHNGSANHTTGPPPLSPHLSETRPVDASHPRGWSPPTEAEESAQKAVVIGAVSVIAILIFSFISYWVIYSQNGKRDYSAEFEIEVVERYHEKNSGAELSDVELTKEDRRHYNGKGRFSDGDNAEISIEIVNRDKLNRPDQWTWSVTPYDYGPMLAGQIKPDANAAYVERGSWARLQRIELHRVTRNSYSGEVEFTNEDKGDISVTVTSFNPDGSPSNWNYSISPR